MSAVEKAQSQIAKQDDGSVKVTLLSPIRSESGTELLGSMTLRKARFGDLVEFDGKGDWEGAIAMAVRLSGAPMPLVEKLSIDDAFAVRLAVNMATSGN